MDNFLPVSSFIYKSLYEAAQSSKVVAFSGLPGVGKSLFINQFMSLASSMDKGVAVIQWDIARKAFETPDTSAVYPMEAGEVHNGVKLSAGKWLVDTLKEWLVKNKSEKSIMLIESPLVGHRFIEIMKTVQDPELESFLSGSLFSVMVPIPSIEVRNKIEEDRRRQISDDAKSWIGAKPSVMLRLWKTICGIANELGMNVPLEGQPPYDPEVYEYVFNRILQKRNFVPLRVDEIYEVNIQNEMSLHDTGSMRPDPDAAMHCFN